MRYSLAISLCALIGFQAAGCRDRQEDEQRALLTPPDPRAQEEARRLERRVYGDDGELIESDQTVAGLVMPKGLTPDRTLDHQWIFRAEHIPADALARYFQRRLDSRTIERKATAVVFGDAVPKGKPDAPRLRVQVVQLRGSARSSQLYIREAVPFVPTIPPAEAAARIEAQRKYAD